MKHVKLSAFEPLFKRWDSGFKPEGNNEPAFKRLEFDFKPENKLKLWFCSCMVTQMLANKIDINEIAAYIHNIAEPFAEETFSTQPYDAILISDIYQQLKNNDRSLFWLNKLLEKTPSHPEANFRAMKLHIANNHPADAISCYENISPEDEFYEKAGYELTHAYMADLPLHIKKKSVLGDEKGLADRKKANAERRESLLQILQDYALNVPGELGLELRQIIAHEYIHNGNIDKGIDHTIDLSDNSNPTSYKLFLEQARITEKLQKKLNKSKSKMESCASKC